MEKQSGTAEQLRQQFEAAIDHLWETEWSRRSEGEASAGFATPGAIPGASCTGTRRLPQGCVKVR